MALSKRTCFRMARGRSGPFIIRAGGYGIRILKAGFGIRTCDSSRSFYASLVRNSMQMSSGEGPSRALILTPGRRISLVGNRLRSGSVTSFSPFH